VAAATVFMEEGITVVQPKKLVTFPGIVRKMTCTTAHAENKHGLDLNDVVKERMGALQLLVEMISANVPDLEWFI